MVKDKYPMIPLTYGIFKKNEQMNKIEQNQTCRYREQTSGYRREGISKERKKIKTVLSWKPGKERALSTAFFQFLSLFNILIFTFCSSWFSAFTKYCDKILFILIMVGFWHPLKFCAYGKCLTGLSLAPVLVLKDWNLYETLTNYNIV